MKQNFKIVYESDGRNLTIGDGAGGPTQMPLHIMRLIASEALNAVLAASPCKCVDCMMMVYLRDRLRSSVGAMRIEGDEPHVIDKAKLC